MSDREVIEAEIRHLLATETRTTVLSDKLFAQETGLFGRLAADEAERRAVSRSELFRQAQARVSELIRRDSDALTEAAALVRQRLPDTEFRLTLDFTPRVAS